MPDEVLTKYHIDESLLQSGRLPEGWEADYFAALASLAWEMRDNQAISGEAVDAIHWVSFHLWFRYLSWSISTSLTNNETEEALGRVQLESELFAWNMLPVSSHARHQAYNDNPNFHERALVQMCLFDNCVLEPTEFQTSDVMEWTTAYRAHVMSLLNWWTSNRLWNTWTVQAIRFASVYLGVAMLPVEGNVVADGVPGLAPSRISATIARLKPVLPKSTVQVISRWLRLAHLPRDADGRPAILSAYPPSHRASVRTVSESVLQSCRPRTD